MDNSNKVEQEVQLKDKRIIYKTDNGFTSWVKKNKDAVPEKVSAEYYKKAFKHRI